MPEPASHAALQVLNSCWTRSQARSHIGHTGVTQELQLGHTGVGGAKGTLSGDKMVICDEMEAVGNEPIPLDSFDSAYLLTRNEPHSNAITISLQ